MPASESTRRWPYGAGFAVGLAIGVALGLAYSAAAALIFLLRRAVGAPPSEYTFPEILLLYVIGFSATGLIAGALNPLARTAPGAVGLGILAFTPVACGAMFIVTGNLMLGNPSDLFALGMTAGLVGGGLGYAAWREFVRGEG